MAKIKKILAWIIIINFIPVLSGVIFAILHDPFLYGYVYGFGLVGLVLVFYWILLLTVYIDEN